MSKTISAALLLFLSVAAGAASAQTITSYNDPAYAGNQFFTGNLGLDFNVTAPIVVTSLGAFNANGAAGFAGIISVGIFNRNTTTQVGPTATLSGTNGTLVDGDRFVAVTPFVLPVGNYSVVAVGFSRADQDGNATIAGWQGSAENTGGGLITFVGTGRYDNNPTLDYPTTVPPGGPSNIFNAGTFQFRALPADAVQVSYAANLAAGDSIINLTSAGAVNGFDPAGDICANVYVFAEDQQLIACCTCPLTPDHLKTLSTQKDLISNTLTPGVPIGITTMLLASTGACNASTVTLANLAGGLRAWGTKIHTLPGGGFGVTENTFSDVPLSVTELAKLTSFCAFIQADGSNFGICGSCKEGAAGASKQ